MNLISPRYTVPLTREQERSTIEKARCGDQDSIDSLILSNYRFLVKVAHTFRRRGVDVEDLISEGILGLRRAVDIFDPATGNRFISYAVWWIRRYIITAIREQGLTVQLPANYYVNYRGKSEAQIEAHAKSIRSVKSSPSIDGLMTAGIDMIDSGPRADKVAEESRNAALIDTLMAGMDDIDKTIIRSRYGLGSGHVEQLQSLGDRYGVSKERIRQRQLKAEDAMRCGIRRRNRDARSKLQRST